MLHEFYLGLFKIHILYHASKDKIYGVAIMAEVNRHGYNIGPGTMYPILHNLEKEGLLESARQAISGKTRRYYHITEKGRLVLEEARIKVRELVNEILEEK